MQSRAAQSPIRPMDASSAAIAQARQILANADNISDASTIIKLIRAADRLHAAAAILLAASSGIDTTSGLTAETLLRLDARLIDQDARRISQLADTLRQMPHLTRSLHANIISTSQAIQIASETRHATRSGRARIDDHLADHAQALTSSEPEHILDEIRDHLWTDRADLARRREQRAHDASFLALQASLDGGGSLYGRTDAIGFATISHALDTTIGKPDPQRTRAQRRMDALISLCETNGGRSGTRTRPRILVTTSLHALSALGASEAARLLAATPSRPQRITALSLQMLACDADLTPIIVHHGTPIGIGDTRSTIPTKIRTALIARDGGCRMPGCRMPARWTDAHHIRPRSHGGDARLDNLILLCRRCHRRIHHHRWKITIHNDTIHFHHRGKTYISHPRARPPTRE